MRLDRLADARGEPTGQQQPPRSDEDGGRNQRSRCAAASQQRGRARDLDACLLDPPRTVRRVDIGKRERRTDDELQSRTSWIARQGQRDAQLRVARSRARNCESTAIPPTRRKRWLGVMYTVSLVTSVRNGPSAVPARTSVSRTPAGPRRSNSLRKWPEEDDAPVVTWIG